MTDQLDRGNDSEKSRFLPARPGYLGETHSGQQPQELVGKLAQATQAREDPAPSNRNASEELDHMAAMM